jgi:hypothetical protein
LLPIVAWYAYAYELGKLYGNTFGILAGGYSKFPTAALLKDPHFYGSALFHAAMYHMTPVVALLFLVGLWGSISKRQQSANGVLLVWLGSVALYALVAGKGVAEGHYQYLLGVVPVCSLIAAYGGGMTVRALDEKFLSRQGRAARIAFGGTLLVVLLLFWKLGDARYVRSQETFALPDWRMKRTTGLLVNQLTPQGSLIVVIDDQMDDYTPTTCMTPPDIFYFGDRKGWYRSMAWIRSDEFDRFAAQGACYVVVSGHSMRTWKQNHQDLDAYLHERCKVVYEGEEGIIFALGENGQHEAGELGECLEGAVGRKQ